MTREPVSEQRVAEIVVTYLEALGADVYQEVEVPGVRIDRSGGAAVFVRDGEAR